MQDISSFGFALRIIASNTFPQGFDVTQFTDDTDPMDAPSLQYADGASGANGDLITWSKANPLKINVAVIPDSDDDKNLAVLAEANRVAKGKRPARDVITCIVIYADGSTAQLDPGKLTDAMPMKSPGSAGRYKSKVYGFMFENFTIGNGG